MRRVTSKEIHVWILLSHAVPVRARTFRLAVGKSGYTDADILGQSVQKPALSISPLMHMHLIRIPTRSGNGYLPGSTVPYDIEVELEKGKWTSIVKDDDACCFKSKHFPAVLIPGPRVPDHRILYGSCRKLHADGRDPMPAAVEAIESSASLQRPHALFLTGDQLYADEVPRLLTGTLAILVERLGGGTEPKLPVDRGTIPPLGEPRGDWLRRKARFTTGEGENHLLAFWEFTAFYLLSFNAAFWPSANELKDESETRVLNEADKASNVAFRNEDRTGYRMAVRSAISDFEQERKALEESRTATQALSKLMANASTLMIFDDHEVTDDWNLSQGWVERVGGSELGCRVVANALAAFWVFQGFGNDPDRTDCPSAEEIAKTIDAYVSGKKGTALSYEDLMRTRMRWHFTFSQTPPVFCIDTRTQRVCAKVKKRRYGLEDEEDVSSNIELANAAQFEAMEAWLASVEPSECPIIISAVPVFSFTFLESLQEWISSKDEAFAELLDNEGWRSNPGSFFRFAQALAAFKGEAIAVISGDLHFGFVREATIALQSKTVRVLQLTSSAIRNEAPSLVRELIKVRSDHPPLQGEQTWWRPKNETIGILKAGVKPEVVAAFTEAYGPPEFKESSRAIDLRRPAAPGGVPARNASIFANHMAMLTVGRRKLVNSFILDPDSKERLAAFDWSW